MNGLELRKAALEAAGWKVITKEAPRKERWGQTSYYLMPPASNATFFTNHGVDQCWQHAPAVESSVDAALQWLTLGEGCNWTLASYIAGLVEPGWIARITGEGGRTVFCDTDTLAVAMCQAYLQYKAGA